MAAISECPASARVIIRFGDTTPFEDGSNSAFSSSCSLVASINCVLHASDVPFPCCWVM